MGGICRAIILHIILCSDTIKELEQELIQIDEEIKSLKPNLPLDKANTRCKYRKKFLINIVIKSIDEARRHMIQNIYDKDDTSVAKFCSHGRYKF